MLIAFELSMPKNNSWNGKWSGDDKKYVIVHNFGRGKAKQAKANLLEANGPYYYSFGDGWTARVSVYNVNVNEATVLRKKSAGFCGYDWMVKSILNCGEIKIGA